MSSSQAIFCKIHVKQRKKKHPRGCFFFMLLLPLALVVGDTLGLRRAGFLGCEGQHHQRDQVRQHPVHVGADADLRQPIHAVAVDIQAGVDFPVDFTPSIREQRMSIWDVVRSLSVLPQ